MFDIENFNNLKKKNDLLIKLLYIFIITSCFLICIHLIMNIEIFLFITQILLAVSIILFLYSKKINIEVKKMYDEVIRNTLPRKQ